MLHRTQSFVLTISFGSQDAIFWPMVKAWGVALAAAPAKPIHLHRRLNILKSGDGNGPSRERQAPESVVAIARAPSHVEALAKLCKSASFASRFANCQCANCIWRSEQACSRVRFVKKWYCISCKGKLQRKLWIVAYDAEHKGFDKVCSNCCFYQKK